MRIALSIILSLFLTSTTLAGPKVSTGSFPDWLAAIHPDNEKTPAPGDISDGYYYELLDMQIHLLRHTEYTHFIRHIVNESGVQDQSEVSITFSPEFQQVVFHRVRILRDGAVIDQLDPNRIKVVQEETDAGDFEYNGLKRAFITLKDVRKGDRIEVAYSVIGFNPIFGDRYTDEFSLGRSTAIGNYFKTVITAANRPLHITTLNGAPAPDQQRQGNTIVYRWSNPPLKTWESSSTAPDWYNDFPTVYITEYNSWQEVVGWGLTTFHHYQYPLPAGLQQKIAAWRQTAGGNKDLLANLATRFVQNDVRYLGLEIGPHTEQPHTPAEVYTGRFGDCKDKALLLSVILQHEGIPACVALVNTTTGRRLPTEAPSPGEFDHAIVAIQRPGGMWLFVDPTMSGQRGELTDLFIPDYGYALLLRDGQDSLQRIRPGQVYDYFVQEQLDARYDDTSKFTVTSTYNGGAADKIRGELAETSMKDLQESYTKYYASEFENIHTDGAITWTDDSLKDQLTVKEFYAIPSVWTVDRKGRRSCDFQAKLINEFLPDPSTAPTDAPFGLTWPIHIHYTLHLSLPENWSFGSEALHIKNDAYQFDFTPETNGKEMTLHYNLVTFDDHIPAAAVAQYKADYKTMTDKIFFQLYNDGDPSSAADPSSATDPSSAVGPSSAADPSSGHTNSDLAYIARQSARPCWPAIWLTFFYALFFSRLFVYFNSRSEDTHYAPGSGYPIGGWIMFLGISITLGLLFDAIQFLQSNYYSYNNWIAWQNAGGVSLEYLYLGQLAIHLNFMAIAGAVLYWFLRKRDIFPRMFIWYMGILLSGRLLLIALFYSIHIPSPLTAYRDDLPWAFARTAVYAAIWVSYVLRSDQVRSTFLEPYRQDLI
jgi:hypothetical protein